MAKGVSATGAVFMALMAFFFLPKPARAGRREPDAGTVEEMRRIEFTRIDYDRGAEPYYAYIKGAIPVLVSAPHGAKHYRASEGAWRKEDAYTSSLAIVLGRLTGAHVLYVKNRTFEDPNNDGASEYKEALKRAVEKGRIRFVLDLHGSSPERPFKVDIGIMESASSSCSCPTFRDDLETAFSGFEPEIFNQCFPARSSGTITRFARDTLGIEAAQVEINAKYRIVEGKSSGFRADPGAVIELTGRLVAAIRAINERIGRGL